MFEIGEIIKRRCLSKHFALMVHSYTFLVYLCHSKPALCFAELSFITIFLCGLLYNRPLHVSYNLLCYTLPRVLSDIPHSYLGK